MVPAATPATPTAAPAQPPPIAVACQCGQRFAAPPHLAGKRVACPACKNPIQVPSAGAARPSPAAPSAPAPANTDGFWDEIKSDTKTPQEIYAEQTAKKEPPSPAKAISYAIDRLAKGATPALVYDELRELGVGPEESERIVEDLQEGKKGSIKGGPRSSHSSKVGMAFWGLSTPGGLSLIGGILMVVLMFMRDDLDRVEVYTFIAMIVYLFVVGIGAIATSVLLQNRFKPARYIGFFFAILSLCGSPLHMICGVCALISLSSSDMTSYLNGK